MSRAPPLAKGRVALPFALMHRAGSDIAEAILAALLELRPGATICPGELARRLGSTQAELRPVLSRLASDRRIRITQRGVPADLVRLRGPYRVAPSGPSDR